MILQSLRNGWSTAHSRWGLAVVVWAANLLMAAGVAWVVAWLLGEAAGSSLATSVLTEGYDHTVISDLRAEGFSYGRTAITALLVAAPLSALVQTFLTGGMIAGVLERPRSPVWHFAASSVAYAGRFLRLLLLGLMLLLGLATLLALLVWAGAPQMTTERELAALAGAAAAVFLAVSGAVWTAIEYARIWIVREHTASVRVALRKGFGLLLRHPAATVTIQLAGIAAVAITVALQAVVGMPVAMESVAGITAVVLVHQTAVVVRWFLRLALIASQVSLLKVALPPADGQKP